MSKICNHTLMIAICFITCLLLISGCSSNKQDTLPSISTVQQDNSQSDQQKIEKLPNIVEKKYVVFQDYADTEASNLVLDDFAKVINLEIARQDPYQHRLKMFGRELFIINAAVSFDKGFLICGYILMEGESDSDCWSMNYTVFRDHTIAYGKSLGAAMQDKVLVYFADGQTVSCSLPNIPFIDNEKWIGVLTDGYIAIADGQTWIRNMESIGRDCEIGNKHYSDMLSVSSLYWKEENNQIWNIYRYTQMLSEDELKTLRELNPVSVSIADEVMRTERYLLNNETAKEYIWRSNNNVEYSKLKEIKSISEITIEGLDDKDEMFWIDLDKDDGSEKMCFDNLRLDTPTKKPGNYCLIIKHNGNSDLDNQDIYYSLFVIIV